MRGLASICIGLLALAVGWAGPSSACSVVKPMPQDGETFEQAELRVKQEFQRRVWDDADSVYLARGWRGASLTTSSLFRIVTIAGLPGPRVTKVSSARYGRCGEAIRELAPTGVLIIFASRVSREDAPWQPWRWGRLEVDRSLEPSDVVVPEHAQMLRHAADAMRAHHG